MMKKFISLMLALIMIFCALPVQSFAWEMDPTDLDAIDLEDVGDELDDKLFGYEFMNKIKAHDYDVQREYFNQMNLLKQQNSISFLKGFKSTLNLANGIYTLLKNIGVIEDPQKAKFKNIIEMLSEIRKTVGEIDKKADTIEKTLSTEFSKMDLEFSQLKYDANQKAWTDFFTVGAYKDMNDIIAAYNSQVNTTLLKYAKGWQTGSESGIRALYSGELEALVLSGDNMDGVGEEIPSRPRWSDDEDSIRIKSSITLPGKYIKIENLTLNADNYQEFLNKAVKAGVISAANDNKLDAPESFYTEWNALTDEAKEVKAEEIAAQLMDSLHYEVIHSVANSTKSGKGTFASEFKAKYDLFCNTLLGSKSVTSPLTAAYNKLVATHAFEGEALGDAIAYTSLLGTLSIQYGTYATMITALDESMSSAKKQDAERNKKVTYNYVLYMLDNFLTGYDNYCYPLKGLVEFHDVVLVSEAKFNGTGFSDATYTNSLPWALMDSADYDINKTPEQKKEAAGKIKNMLSLRDISVLYYYYQQTGDKDFLSYLDKNSAVASGIAEDAEHSTTVLTGDYEVKNLKPGSAAKLTFHSFGFAFNNPWRDEGGMEGRTVDKLDNCEDHNGKFYAHEQLFGSTFDISGGAKGSNSTADVSGRTNLNTYLVNRVLEYLYYAGYDGSTTYGIHVVETDGKYAKTTNISGYNQNSVGTESSKTFKGATYTVSVSKDFGTIVVNPLPEKNEAGKKTASAFSNGNIALICGGAVLVLAAGFGVGFGISKKKKSKVSEG